MQHYGTINLRHIEVTCLWFGSACVVPGWEGGVIREGFPEKVPQEKLSKYRELKASGAGIKPVSQGHLEKEIHETTVFSPDSNTKSSMKLLTNTTPWPPESESAALGLGTGDFNNLHMQFWGTTRVESH